MPVIRFLVGGTIIALVPVIAQKLGPAAAGIFLLFPAVTLIGLMFLGLDQGVSAVSSASRAGLYGLPTVVAFLLGVHLMASRGQALTLALGAGLACWLCVAGLAWWATSSA